MKGLRGTEAGLTHANPALPPPAVGVVEIGVELGWAVDFLVLVEVGLAAGVPLAEVAEVMGAAFEVGRALLVVEGTATRVLVVGRGLQRRVSARFFFARRLWCPRPRAWLGEKSTERALTGAGPNEQARRARDEKAMRLSSLAAITGWS